MESPDLINERPRPIAVGPQSEPDDSTEPHPSFGPKLVVLLFVLTGGLFGAVTLGELVSSFFR